MWKIIVKRYVKLYNKNNVLFCNTTTLLMYLIRMCPMWEISFVIYCEIGHSLCLNCIDTITAYFIYFYFYLVIQNHTLCNLWARLENSNRINGNNKTSFDQLKEFPLAALINYLEKSIDCERWVFARNLCMNLAPKTNCRGCVWKKMRVSNNALVMFCSWMWRMETTLMLIISTDFNL